MAAARLPVFFVSHGGGPWPYVDGMKQSLALTERTFRELPARLPATPRAILMISAHWEASRFTVSAAAHPPMLYDYYGFPDHTYRIQYPAPGSPDLAARVAASLRQAGIESRLDDQRGFDHGTFIPLGLMFPAAQIPVVALSLKSGYDPGEHIRAGQALVALRDEGVLIIGSGLTYHNMRGFGRSESGAAAQAFEAYLHQAVSDANTGERIERLLDWTSAPAARLSHPQEDHLLPLMVATGAAADDAGFRICLDRALNVAMASYQFGGAPLPVAA